jgi:hypothetical protein
LLRRATVAVGSPELQAPDRTLDFRGKSRVWNWPEGAGPKEQAGRPDRWVGEIPIKNQMTTSTAIVLTGSAS